MVHIAGHIEAQEPTVKFLPTDKQMEDVLGTGSTIDKGDVAESAVYDYPATDAKSFKNILAEESLNLDGDAALFWSGADVGDYQNFIPIFNRTKAIGYIDGLEPHVIAEGSNVDRLTEIYNIVTHNRDVIHENQDYEKVKNLRDTESKAWFLTKDGKKFLLDFTKDEDIGAVKNFFGWLLPGIDSRKQLLNRKRIEKELHALGLTTEKAENLREQLKESHYWIDGGGKVQYHEQTKDLSYLIPDPSARNWNSFQFQARQILGNIIDDFPSMILAGYSWLSKEYQTGDMAPDKSLLEPEKNVNMFGMDVTKLRAGEIDFPTDEDLLKNPEQLIADVDEYARQSQIELEFTTELVSHFDEKKHTESWWASFTNLHKNIVYNNTGFELSEKMIDYLENPTDSFLYHATDIIAEGLPYIAVIEAFAIGYGLRGTMIMNEATDYVLANTGQGLKHANPIKALNYYLEKYVVDSKLKRNPNKFIERTMTRLEERQIGNTGIKRLRANLEKEIGSVTKRIDEAKAKGNVKLVEKLSLARDTLVKNQLDLTPRYWTKTQKSLFKNEIFASIFGGVARDLWGDGLAAAGWEISGALVEPFVFSRGFGATAKFTAIHTARLLDNISFIPKVDNITDYLRAKSISLKVEDLTITDAKTGLKRKLTNSEVRSVRKFIGIMDEMPVDQRVQVLATMNTADESLQTLMKGLPEDSQSEIKFTIAQYTGLAALQAVAEMYNTSRITKAFTAADLIQINEEVGESRNLMTLVSERLTALLQKHPNNAQLEDFAGKITANIALIDTLVLKKEQEFANALEAMVDLEKGVNLFDNPGMMNKNLDELYNMLEKIKEEGFDDSVQDTASRLLNEFDQRILDDMKIVAESLGTDGSTYKSNGFAGIVMALKEADRMAYRKAYTALYETDKNFKINFTEYFDDVMSGLFPDGRFGKLKKATGVFSNKLPSTAETSRFVKVVNAATTKSTGDFIIDLNNRKILKNVWNNLADDSDEALAITTILNRKRNLTESEMVQVFDGLKFFLKETNTAYRDAPANAISGIDIRDLILGMDKNADIPIILNLQEAMEFRSGIGAFAFSAIKADHPPKTRTFMEMYDTIKNTIEESINNSGNNELVENYAEAHNAFRNYINKYNNARFTDLKKWVTTTDSGTQTKVTQSKNGDSTQKLEKLETTDEYTTNIYREVTGDETTNIARFTTLTDSSNWIIYSKLLNDEKYANNFMKNVIIPLVGERDPSRVIEGVADDINYIVDLSNPTTLKKLEIVRGFLKDGLGNFFRRSPQGKIILGDSNVKKVLGEDKINLYQTPSADKISKIKIHDEAIHWFKIQGADGKHIDLLQIDNVINANLSFDMLLSRNRFVADLTLTNQKSFAKQYKKAKQKTQQLILEFKNDLLKFGDKSVVYNFGQTLTDPDIFVKRILIGDGGLGQYNKLKNVIVGTGSNQMSEAAFDKVTRELFAEYFFKNFSRPDMAKAGVKRGAVPLLDMKTAHNFSENAVGAKAFLEQNRKNLSEILGADHLKEIDAILNLVIIKNGISKTGVQAASLPKSLSVESLMSRIYSINRGIISPNYVATEVAITRFRKNQGNIMRAIIEEPELAKVIRKVLESEDIYKDPLTNATLQKLLNKTVIKAILLRESLQINVEGIDGPLGFDIDSEEERQENMLNEMNQEMYKIQDRL